MTLETVVICHIHNWNLMCQPAKLHSDLSPGQMPKIIIIILRKYKKVVLVIQWLTLTAHAFIADHLQHFAWLHFTCS